MPKPQKNTAAVVRKLIEEPVMGSGYRIWDIEYVKEGSEWYLRVTIDSDDGITIEDCERVHRLIDPLLDEADPIENSYRLEVSSPGVERTLRTDSHFASSVGQQVVLKLFSARGGKKQLRGTLLSFTDGNIELLTPEGTIEKLERTAISRANIYYDYDAESGRRKK